MTNPFQHAPAGERSAGASPDGTLGGDAKEQLLIDYATRYGCRTLVETGLWNGRGSGLRSFEFGIVDLYIAVDLQQANIDALPKRIGVVGLVGDSAEWIPSTLEAEMLSPPALFWLDAHAVDEQEGAPPCPLRPELEAIIAWQHAAGSVVLVDDLRMMGRLDWPRLAEVRTLVDGAGVWEREERDDIMRLTPRRP